MKQPLPAPALASISEEASVQEPVIRTGDRRQSQDEQLEEVMDMLATDLSVSNGGRASSATSSASDIQGGQREELVPDDMSLDEFKKRTLENAQLENRRICRQEGTRRRKFRTCVTVERFVSAAFRRQGFHRKKTCSIGMNTKT